MNRVTVFSAHILAAIALIVAPTLAAKEQEPLRLTPTTTWLVNYGLDSCRLARKFGTDDQQVMLTIDRFSPGDIFHLAVSGQLVELHSVRPSMAIQFGANEAEQQRDFKQGEMADKRPAIIFTTGMRLAANSDADDAAEKAASDGKGVELAPIGPDREQAVDHIRLGRPLSRPLVLATGSLGAPFAALRKCTDELIEHWGVDVAALATQSRSIQPTGNPARWMNSSDYPTDMLVRGQQAIVHFRLSVGADGRPTACHIQQSTRPAAFDDAVCKSIMKRARFDPALDAGGKPIASYYLNSVRFQM